MATKPELITIFPSRGATQVPVGNSSVVVVNIAILPTNSTDDMVPVPDGNIDPNSVTISVDGRFAVLNGAVRTGFDVSSNEYTIHSPDVNDGIQYQIKIDPDVADNFAPKGTPESSFNSFSVITVGVKADEVLLDFSRETLEESYVFTTADEIGPEISNFTPLNGSIDVLTNTNIFFKIVDDLTGSGINRSSIGVMVDGNEAIINGNLVPGYRGYINPIEKGFNILIDPTENFSSYSDIDVYIAAVDNDSANIVNGFFTFKTADIVPPQIQLISPVEDATSVLLSAAVTIDVVDSIPSSGINKDSIQLKLFGEDAIVNGVLQPEYASTFPDGIHMVGGNAIIQAVPIAGWNATSLIEVELYLEDNGDQSLSYSYSFVTVDETIPSLVNLYPQDGDTGILKETDIRLSINDQELGSGVDRDSIIIKVQGVDVFDISTTIEVGGTFDTPSAFDIYGNVTKRGFTGSIVENSTNGFNIIINPNENFELLEFVEVSVYAEDNSGNILTTTDYSFRIIDVDKLITTAFPRGGLFRNYLDGEGRVDSSHFIRKTGITLSTNMGEGYGPPITYYTLDGSEPVADVYGRVEGTTKVYVGEPIKIQKEGITVLRFFSVDPFGFDNDQPLVIGGYGDVSGDGYSDGYGDCYGSRGIWARITEDVYGSTNSITVEDIVDLKQIPLFRVGDEVLVYDNNTNSIFTKITDVDLDQKIIELEHNVNNLTVDQYAKIELAFRRPCDGYGDGYGDAYGPPLPLRINEDAFDFMGNRETPIKREVYAVDIFPLQYSPVIGARLTRDVLISSRNIYVEDIEGFNQIDIFKKGNVVYVFDDNTPPIVTSIFNIDSVGKIITLDDEVNNLTISKNARIQLINVPIDPNLAIKIDNFPRYLYIGSDALGKNQADSVLEEFRILNKASTNSEIVADFSLQAKNVSFQLKEGEPVLSEEDEAKLSDAEIDRINLPDNTLVYIPFTESVQSLPGVGKLKEPLQPIIDKEASSNDVLVKVKYKRGTYIDRELITRSYERLTPIELNVIVIFEGVD